MLLSNLAFTQNEGTPFIRNYSPDEYHGYSQNWCSEQDIRGVMYFGNGKGILEYDGKNWRRFFTQNITTVLSMGKDSDGRIYVGAEGEIGYLAPDSTGLVSYFSLLDKIPDDEKTFSYVWHVYANELGVYFVTPEKVMKISPKKTTIWKPKSSYFTAFMCKGQFFIQDNDKGLLIEKNDSLIQPNIEEKFGDIRAILPYKNQFMFVTGKRSFFSFDGKNKLEKINTQAEEILKAQSLYKGIMLPDSSYAFATLHGGIVITNQKGNIKNIINEKFGLLSNIVYGLFADNHGGLWANLGNGLARIEVSSPFTYFNKFHGINDVIQDLTVFDNELYISSLEGVFVLKNSSIDDKGFHEATLKKFEDFKTQIYSSSVFNNGILFSGSGGVYFYDKQKFSNTFHNENEICVKASRFHKNVYFVGESGSIHAVKFENNKWIPFEIYSKGIEDVYYLIESNSNTLWASTVNHGIIKCTFKDTSNFNSKIEKYDTTKGVPAGMTEINFINNKIVTGTSKGIYYFNEKQNLFLPDTLHDSTLFNGKNTVYLLNTDSLNNLWGLSEKSIFVEKNNKIFNLPFRRLKFTDMYKILPEDNGICWFGGTNGLIRYDEKVEAKYLSAFHTTLKRVVISRDTVFNGAYSDSLGFVTFTQPDYLKKSFKYKNNSEIFEFACPSFDNEESNSYSYFLEGYDEDWSDWTFENKKEYTNLPEGNYIFHVKSKNVYLLEGNETTFSFEILPPWYRTILAYFIFGIATIILIYLIVIINTRRLRKANIRLEGIVTERTQEIRQQNAEILQQKEEITAQRDEIEAQRDNLIILNEEINQQKEEIESQRDEIEKQRDFVAQQRDQIAFHNKEMTDSIRYAKIIQSAIMHPTEFLRTLLPESFIFFRPKDIVSGDFYWFTKINQKVYVAAVDCTGHGVPGGFMSMLGMSFLNEIASNIKLGVANYTASEILFELRKMVIKSLNQTEFETENSSEKAIVKDGMDVALCIIDKENKMLEFAGANNPLYIVKRSKFKASNPKLQEIADDSVNELVEVKGDKMPIGAYIDNEKPFTNHNIEISENDSFYIFTDGFADQFGGEAGKKYKYNKMKDLFLKNSVENFQKQHDLVKSEFENWTKCSGNDYEQIDDVLIIGFKI